MHSYSWQGRAISDSSEEVDTEIRFHHNGDFSGNVVINVPTHIAQPAVRHFTEGEEDKHIAEIHIPYDALEIFILDAVRSLRIAQLENLTVEEMRTDFSA
jgi:hypothetical protein